MSLYPSPSAHCYWLSPTSVRQSASVVRPSWIWGKGDHVLPQLVTAVKTGQFTWIAQGRYPYMTTHVTNVCHGAILAAERSPGGQAYFLSDGDVVQFRQWVTTLLQIAGIKPGRLSTPAISSGFSC